MNILDKAIKFSKVNNKWIIIFLVISIPRYLYIIFNHNLLPDSYFYLTIARNISDGCGFASNYLPGDCEPLVGGYFPGYPYFIYLVKSLGFGNKVIPLIVSFCTTISLLYFISTLNRLGLEGKRLYFYSFFIGLSPISIGFSRFILIEPIIYIFSITLITELIKIISNPKDFKAIFKRFIVLSILAIYFKPTSFVLLLPIIFSVLILFGLEKFIKYSIIFSLIISFSILPWGLRDIKYGAIIPFKVNSSMAPKNVKGFAKWVSSFSLTEYDYALSMFPLIAHNNGDRKKVKLIVSQNPFINNKDEDYKQAREILDKENPEIKRGFTKQEENEFLEMAKERFKKNGFLGNIFLFVIKSTGVLLNPLNSWGWPASIGVDASYHNLNISQIIKSLFKLFLFTYRVFIFSLFFKNLLNFLRLFNPYKLLSKNNKRLFQDNIFLISSLLVLSLNLIMYIGIFGFLEHRYFYQIMPWIEVSVLLGLNNFRNLKSYPLVKNNIS